MTDECRSRNELSDALRHSADELPDDLVITRGLMRMAADRLATLEAAQSETGTLQAIKAFLDKEYVSNKPAHEILDGLDRLLKEGK